MTLEELVEILEEVVDLSGLQADEKSVLGEDIPLDSREMLQVLARIESRCRFRFPAREIVMLTTLGDLLHAVNRLQIKV